MNNNKKESDKHELENEENEDKEKEQSENDLIHKLLKLSKKEKENRKQYELNGSSNVSSLKYLASFIKTATKHGENEINIYNTFHIHINSDMTSD